MADSRNRRRRDPEATRGAILDAAEKLFLERGPNDSATSEIARQAGVTKSLIHHHFGSKKELWTEVKRRHFAQYYAVQKEMLQSGGGAELLRRSVVAYFRFLQGDPRSVRFMAWRFVEEDDLSLEQERELFELGVKRLQEAQQEGDLRADIEPMSMIKSFLAMCLHWFQSKPMLREMQPDADHEALEERYLEDIQRIFLGGVRAATDPRDDRSEQPAR